MEPLPPPRRPFPLVLCAPKPSSCAVMRCMCSATRAPHLVAVQCGRCEWCFSRSGVGIVWHSHGGGERDNDHNAGHKEVACSSSVAAVDGTRGFGETWRDDTRHVWEESGKHESYNRNGNGGHGGHSGAAGHALSMELLGKRQRQSCPTHASQRCAGNKQCHACVEECHGCSRLGGAT